jgi:hypothetical protein
VDRESSLDQHLADPNLEFHGAVTTALILAHRPSPIIDGAQLFDFFFFGEPQLFDFIRAVFASGTTRAAGATRSGGETAQAKRMALNYWRCHLAFTAKINQVRLVVSLSSKGQGSRTTQRQWPVGFMCRRLAIA